MNWLRFTTRRGKLDLVQVRSVWSWFSRYSRNHVGALSLAMLAGVGVVAMQIAVPLPIKVIFDAVLFQKSGGGVLIGWVQSLHASTSQLLIGCCVAVLGIAAIDAVLAYARDIILAQTGQEVVGKIRQDLFRHMKTLPPSVYDRRPTGGLLSRFSGDIQMLRQLLVDALISVSQNTLLIVAVITAMFFLDPLLAVIGLATIPITMIASWRISKGIRAATAKAREKESQVASIAHDVLGAMAIVQAFNREAVEQQRFTRENRSTVRAGVRSTRLESRLMRIVSLASAAGLAIILYLGVRNVLAGTMTTGDLLVFVAYLRMVNKPLRELAKTASQTAKSAACGQRIAELFAIRPAIVNRADAIELTNPRGELEFKQVAFRYDEARPTLCDVDLHIRAGERVAIVGPTGAGKSTLVKLLLRFHDPQSGQVCVDGHDVRDLTTDSLRRSIGWVHQDTVLFGMSVAENIALGRPDADREQIQDCARRVHAHEFIRQLPKGYDTILGQNAVTLSGGQRQRLALARALLREPRILLLDEPASGLDAQTRRIVEEAWMSPANRATTVVICHRLHEMQRFDRVVLIQDGRVVANGPHADLLGSNEAYAALVRSAAESITLRLPEPAA
jgi:ATP-binding cassette, subfamily B, bacterial